MKKTANRVWVIQRCTREWVGTELLYEDVTSRTDLMTHREMLRSLERIGRRNPNDEFRGHNVAAEYARSMREREVAR